MFNQKDIMDMKKYWVLMHPKKQEAYRATGDQIKGFLHELVYPATLKGVSLSITGCQPTATVHIHARVYSTGEWIELFAADDFELGATRYLGLETTPVVYDCIRARTSGQGKKIELDVFGRVTGPETSLLQPPIDLAQAGNGGMIISCSRDPLDAQRLIHPDHPSENDGWHVPNTAEGNEEFILISLSRPSIINHIKLVDPDPNRAIKIYGGYASNKDQTKLDDWVELCSSMLHQDLLPAHTDPKTKAQFKLAWTHLLVCFFPGVSLSRIHIFGWPLTRLDAKALTDQELERNITYQV